MARGGISLIIHCRLSSYFPDEQSSLGIGWVNDL
jgi:hypothetical protein